MIYTREKRVAVRNFACLLIIIACRRHQLRGCPKCGSKEFIEFGHPVNERKGIYDQVFRCAGCGDEITTHLYSVRMS